MDGWIDRLMDQSINQSNLRLLITPLRRTQRGLQEQEYEPINQSVKT